ncbi:carboxymuconolactone decarboxylase family protein [Candidatus Woesearchaeota archaeon]|nr:carboxymuconolactone decarboxylase family protein [Candidatus Woesearchaeota archaeon]
MGEMKDMLDEVNSSLAGLKRDAPEFIRAFHSFMEVSEKGGKLDNKTKELISVALSVATHCKWCIAFHVKNALVAGATKEELIEVCQVAALMGGGPSLMYSQLVFKAIEEFSN